MSRAATIALTLMLVIVASCGWAPEHEIRPRPDFIQAGVEPGDTVEIETTDGETIEFEVTDVTADALEGDGRRVPYSEIAAISKRSWTEPRHPCAGTEPLGCSIPEVVLAVSEFHQEQKKKFHKPCVNHDLCYRNGYATYGIDRETCDAGFYEDMKQECAGGGGLDLLDIKALGLCQIAATQMYEAVRLYGEKAYRTTTSSYCEYR